MNRKVFLKVLGALVGGGFIVLWRNVVQDGVEVNQDSIRKVPIPSQKGIYFYDGFYLVNTIGSFKAFSTTCTHAGCRLKSEMDGIITCPCHGSQYQAESGQPLRGPSYKPLKEFKCRIYNQLVEVTIEK